MAICRGGLPHDRWLVQRDHTRVRAGTAIHRGGTEAAHQTEHALLGMIDPEAVGTGGIADACRARHEKALVMRTGNPLDKDPHLLIQMLKPAPFPVIQRRETDGACIDSADGGFKRVQALFRRPVIAAEDGFVFPGKGVAEAVFQDRA